MKNTLDKKTLAVSSNIRKIREFRNYTQDYLAAKLGISQNAYSKIELGYSKLTLDRLFKISALLDVEAANLITNEHIELVPLNAPAKELKSM
jgi:transcriptional regulator with XRE-family HTH domain